jgi:GR25 family glycosyltransferase involved in LPS biosynthesis
MMNWKTYVINLPTAAVRRKFIEKQFRKVPHARYQVVDAVNAFEVGEEWLQSQLDHKQLVKPMSGPQIACTLSHKKALELFIADDSLDYIVILEDDAILPKDYEQIVEDAIGSIDNDDMVMLSGMLMEPFDFMPVAQVGNGTALIKPVKPNVRPFTTAAYLMSKEVARRHVKSIYPVTDVTDSWAYYKKRGSMKIIYLTYPFAVDTEVFQSSRDNKSVKDMIINWIIYFQIPFLYNFFRRRRRVTEMARLKNVKIVQQGAIPVLRNKARLSIKDRVAKIQFAQNTNLNYN